MSPAVLGLTVLFNLIAITPRTTYVSPLAQDWSLPIDISGNTIQYFDDFLHSSLVCDQFGQLHAFWSGSVDSNGLPAIYYSRYDSQWSDPIDIIFDPTSGASSPMALVDSQGMLHVLWLGAGLFHSSASSWSELSATSWSTPSVIISGVRILSAGGFIDDQDVIHVAYALGSEPFAIYYTSSDDRGDTWSSPVLAAPSRPLYVSTEPRLALDKEENLHLVWSEYQLPEGWPPQGVFYSRSSNQGRSWLSPIQLAGYNHGAADIVDAGNELLAVWNATGGEGGRYYKFSADRGTSWSNISKLVEFGFTGVALGQPKLLAIGNNQVAVIMSATNVMADDAMLDMIYLAEWQNRNWTYPELISDPRSTSQLPSACISQGDQLHVIWTSAGRIRYSNLLLEDALSVEIAKLPLPTRSVSLPKSTPSVPAAVEISVADESSIIAKPSQFENHAPAESKIAPNRAITFSAVLVLLFIVLAGLLFAPNRRRT